ncbi:hypothetical protein L7F22_047304 [Adiantum nelumboides]|nr:hypothetical protein [Adiantum nelumboides]
MQCTHAVKGPSSPARPVYGLSSLAWISATHARLGAGMYMSRKQAGMYMSRKQEHRMQVPFFLLGYHSSSSWAKRETAGRYESEPLSSYEWNQSLCKITGRGSFMPITATSLNAHQVDDGHGRSWSKQAGHVIFRASLLAIACAAFLFGKKMALAAAITDPGMVGLPSLQQFKNGLSLLWPKFVQVLEVFRDQGVLLSILLGLSAFFSMAETSITTLWPWKVWFFWSAWDLMTLIYSILDCHYSITNKYNKYIS